MSIDLDDRKHEHRHPWVFSFGILIKEEKNQLLTIHLRICKNQMSQKGKHEIYTHTRIKKMTKILPWRIILMISRFGYIEQRKKNASVCIRVARWIH